MRDVYLAERPAEAATLLDKAIAGCAADDVEEPKLLLQRVNEAKSGKNRMHVDLETPTVDDEVARLEALGARRLEPEATEEHGHRWVVMADPEENQFCVCNRV